MTSSAAELMAMPMDLITYVLLQPSLTAQDLCRLEATCSQLQALVDERVWHEAFLRRRRCPALQPPASWKQEYTRRDAWSRSWRQRIATQTASAGARTAGHPNPMRAVAGHTQKLRRFALKMISAAPLQNNPPTHVATHVVDPLDAADGAFPTIAAALERARPFDVVAVAPGTYHENLRLERPVELVARGSVGSVTIVGTDAPTIEASSCIACRLAGVRIEQRASSGDTSVMSGSVLVKGGALMIVEECVVSSEVGHCIVMQGADSCGYVLHNEVHHAKGVGVLVCDNAKGVIEDNSIACNGRAGVAILSGGDPLIVANKIHDGMDSGVLVSERGRGRVESNDIFGNRRAGVAILKEGAPMLKRNRIHDGRDSGVLVCENGKGSVVDNDIFSNQMAGVAIGRGGASHVTGNAIRDGNGGSLCVSAHSRALISSNVIHHHPRAAMQVPEGLLSEVMQNNDIRDVTSEVAVEGAQSPGGGSGSDMELDHAPRMGACSSLRMRPQDFAAASVVYACSA